MVKRFLSVIGKEIRGLHEAAYLLAGFALLSSVLALVRDKLLAFTFGAGHSLDIYYAAFRIPDFLFASVGSLVSASIVLPYFISRFAKSREDGVAFSDGMFTIFFAGMAAVAIVVWIAAPWLVPLVMPGFAHDPSLPDLILSMRIMLFSPIFLGLSNLFSCLTQMRHRFLVYAASPVVYNLGIIIGVLAFYPFLGLAGLALGVALGAFMHLGIQIPFLATEGLVPRLTRRIEWASMWKIVLTAFPRTLTLSANEFAEFVLVSFASLLTVGSISVFNFAWNLQSVPLALIGASYSSAVFPTLSRLIYEKNCKEFLEKMVAAARHIIFWSMPIAILFIVLRAQIVRTILGAGKFDWADTRLTAALLALFVVSTIAQSLIVLFVRAFYAEGKTKRPLYVNAVSAAIIIVLGYLGVHYYYHAPLFRYFIEGVLKVSGQAGTSVLMLALAYSIGTIVNAILHWIVFERAYPGFTRPVLATLFHSFAASVLMGYASFLSLRIFAGVFPMTKIWGVFMQGFLSGLIGIVVLVITLIILQNREFAEVWRALHRKIWKAPVPPAETAHM